MNTFASDHDLLRYEPNLASDAADVAHELCTGQGRLTDTQITIDQCNRGKLLWQLMGAIAVVHGLSGGQFPITAVRSSPRQSPVLQLAMHNQQDVTPGPVHFVVRTFFEHRQIISTLLTRLCAARRPNIEDQALRRPCALGSLHLIYSALSSAMPDRVDLAVREEVYQALFRQSLKRL